jgi:hypothetical protein
MGKSVTEKTMPRVHAAPQPLIDTRTDLRTTFGDSPTGKERYRVTPSGRRRAPLLQLASAVQRKAIHVLNVIAPRGRRQDERTREALRECSHRVGDLVARLSRSGPADTGSIAQDLEKCFLAAGKLASLAKGQANDPLATVLVRLEVHLASMNLADIASLKASLERANRDSASMDPRLQGTLPCLEGAVRQHLQSRMDAAEQQLVKAITHKTPEMQHPSVLSAGVERFNAAARVLSSPAVPPDMGATVAAHLPGMSTEQLDALGRGLEKIRTSRDGVPPALQATLTALGSQVRTQLCQRIIEGAREQLQAGARRLLQEVPKGPQAAQVAFARFTDSITALLKNHPVNRDDALLNAVAKHIINPLLKENTPDQAAFADLFALLTPSQQHKLLASNSTLLSEPTPEIERMVNAAVQQHLATTQQRFEEAAIALLDNGAALLTQDPARFVTTAVLAASAWQSLNALQEAHAGPLDANLQQRHQELKAYLHENIDLARLPLDVIENEALRELGKMSNTLGLTQGQAAVTAETLRRKDALVQSCVDARIHHLRAMRSGEPQAVFRALQESQAALDLITIPLQQLGVDVGDAADVAIITDDLRQRAAEGLTLAELVEVGQALMSAQVQHTWETISDLGSQVLVDRFTRVDSRTAWASRLMMMSKDYEILVLTVDARLEELDPSGSWQQPSAHAPKTPSELARTSRDVIRTLFHEDLPPWSLGKKAELAGQITHDACMQNLEAMKNTPAESHSLLGQDMGVTEQFVRELVSVDYQIENASGHRQPLIDRAHLAGEKTPERTQQVAIAVNQLRELTDGDAQWLLHVSNMCHKGLVQYAIVAQLSPDSPIGLAGKTGQLMRGKEMSTFTLRRAPGDKIVVRAEYTVDAAEAIYHHQTDSWTELDPGRSGARFSLEIALGRDGTVELVAPATLVHELHPEANP